MPLERFRADSTKEKEKQAEHAILTSRVIDRPMRPLFPKDYRNDVTLNNMVMSVDPECRPGSMSQCWVPQSQPAFPTSRLTVRVP